MPAPAPEPETAPTDPSADPAAGGLHPLLRALSAPRRWLRATYDWTMRWADKPHALAALFLIAVVESSVFPIPPDVLLIAIVAASPRLWLRSAALCTLGSVIGAAGGYLIGTAFMATLGQRIVEFYNAQHHWAKVVELYNGEWGIWFLAAAAFTPIPYKVATIAAGATGMAFVPFLLVSLVGRAARFFLVAALLRVFGPAIRRTLEKNFDLAALAFLVLLVGGFLALKYF
ncbi:MAG TPA: YqaA family protein [Thermoanaerobaculia bacterium]|nr:YqaA family protein [Thermoanaerobaculia bacterium]HQP86847.1 YqaA family protein [Thermoanaerobaculia bacterium]